MTFQNAKRLHNEDKVTIKETNQIATVLDAYVDDSGKHVIIEMVKG